MNQHLAIIDTDISNRQRLAESCRAHGRTVDEFDGAHAFLARDLQPPPVCVIVDGKVDDMTPAQLRAELERRELPSMLVFQVDGQQVDLAVALMKAGADDVLRKPLAVDSLLGRLDDWLAWRRVSGEPLDGLTPREYEVVRLATRGAGNKDIAAQLKISHRTVEVHRRNALRKAGAANVVELTRLVANGGADRPHQPAQVTPPTPRELEVLQLGNAGLCNKDIAVRLGISVRTVESHRSNLLRKASLNLEQPLAPRDEPVGAALDFKDKHQSLHVVPVVNPGGDHEPKPGESAGR